MTQEELELAVGNAAKLVKTTCSIGNNAAWEVMLEGYDHAKQCRRFMQSIKGGKRVAWYFKKAINDFKQYEHNLLKAKVNRMFHVDDMDDEHRRRYGNITDEQFYEFWKGTGAIACRDTRPLITSLWNKHRLNLIHLGIDEEDHKAWLMTAQSCLDMSVTILEGAYRQCDEMRIPRQTTKYVFNQFSLDKVSDSWAKAVYILDPQIKTATADPLDEKNIHTGIEQLMDAWMNSDTIFDSVEGTVVDYDEVWASEAFMKKALREISDTRAAMNEQLDK